MLHAFLFWPFFWFPFHGLITLIVIRGLVAAGEATYYPTAAALISDWHRSGTRSRALSILEGRYARGEIQREEYLQKKQDLSR